RRVTPRIKLAFHVAPGSALPLRLSGKSVSGAIVCAQPLTVSNCFEPRDANDRLLWMIEVGIVPEWWGGNSDSRHEPLIFGVGDLSGSQLESIDPDAVNRPLIVLTLS